MGDFEFLHQRRLSLGGNLLARDNVVLCGWVLTYCKLVTLITSHSSFSALPSHLLGLLCEGRCRYVSLSLHVTDLVFHAIESDSILQSLVAILPFHRPPSAGQTLLRYPIYLYFERPSFSDFPPLFLPFPRHVSCVTV